MILRTFELFQFYEITWWCVQTICDVCLCNYDVYLIKLIVDSILDFNYWNRSNIRFRISKSIEYSISSIEIESKTWRFFENSLESNRIVKKSILTSILSRNINIIHHFASRVWKNLFHHLTLCNRCVLNCLNELLYFLIVCNMQYFFVLFF